MRKFRLFFMAAAAAMMLGACSEDKLDVGPDTPVVDTDTEDGIYMRLNIQMPSSNGSRSYTDADGSDTGIEIGKDYENNVTEAIIVLSDKEYGFIAAATVVDKVVGKEGTNPTYRTVSKFNKQMLASYYTAANVAKEDYDHVYVFVFCNPNLGLRDKILGDGTETNPGLTTGDKAWINEIATLITPATIWTKNQFLMSNNSLAERQIPKDMTDWNKYNVQSKPFDLSGENTDVTIDNSSTNSRGNVKVERSCARFDFRDGSNDDNSNPVDANTYKVVTKDDEAKTGLVNITLQKMALVNMNKQFYFLRRVSPNGTNADMTLCGPELPWFNDASGTPLAKSGNFVVDADQVWKSTMPQTGFGAHFNYPFFNEDNEVDNADMNTDRWATYLLSDVLGRDADTDETWNDGQTHPEYKIWRYATENTIAPDVINPGAADPSFSYATQVNGITTGVVFKGQMKATSAANIENPTTFEERNEKALYDALNGATGENDPILFSFNNMLYSGWELVREAAVEESISDIRWIGDGDMGDTSKGGHWDFDINRELSLYKAVFGNGGFGEYKYMYTVITTEGEGDDQKEVITTHEYTVIDTMRLDQNCANTKWEDWQKGDTADLLKEFKSQAVDKAGFTLYQSSRDAQFGWGYYCYYYYWNRHNDNGQNGIMGPMEFCVVRNNVYKLAVTKISRLGHPRIAENDPDRPQPGTPDESEDVYITVTSEVLPWVVRLNNIEF